jgi:heme exporter protein D
MSTIPKNTGTQDDQNITKGKGNLVSRRDFTRETSVQSFLWGASALLLVTLAVAMVVSLAKRTRHCHLTYNRRRDRVENNRATPEHYFDANIRPMTRRLRDAQRYVERDLENTCGPQLPKTSECYQRQLHLWRKYIDDHVGSGDFPGEAHDIPFKTAHENGIVLTDTTQPYTEAFESSNFFDVFLHPDERFMRQ